MLLYSVQVTVAGSKQMKEMNIKKEHLTETTHTLKHAGGSTLLTVIGSSSINI